MTIKAQREIHKILSLILSMTMAGLFIQGMIVGKAANQLDAMGSTIFLAWLLYGYEILAKKHLPISLHFTWTLFIFMANGVGSAFRVYDTLPWWDIMLHLCSGYLISVAAMYILKIIKCDKIPKIGYILFVLGFGTLIACAWELIEFIADTFFGADMQIAASGVKDTMHDIISALAGSLIWLIMYLLQLKYKFKDLTYLFIKDFDRPEYTAKYDRHKKCYIYEKETVEIPSTDENHNTDINLDDVDNTPPTIEEVKIINLEEE